METEYRILDGNDMTDRQLLQAAALDHKVILGNIGWKSKQFWDICMPVLKFILMPS